jgi:tRNA pseudouridine55 synthase
MDGILNIDKPRGRTSFSIVAAVRRLSGEKRVGHAGTLDPAASGVLPVCTGKATRVIEYLMNDTKEYRAEIEFGLTTSTYDAEGEITGRYATSGLSLEKLESALPAFTGEVYQIPPMYSALKHKGKPLYKLAREGITVERESRPVTIQSIEITGWQPPVFIAEIVCGKGTYIRSLAHDLGQAIGCGAYLKSLVRTRCGIFDINHAVTADKLEEAFKTGSWQAFVYPIDSVMEHFKTITANEEDSKDIGYGRPVTIDDTDNPGDREIRRAYSPEGDFLAIIRFDSGTGQWYPEKVFKQPENPLQKE